VPSLELRSPSRRGGSPINPSNLKKAAGAILLGIGGNAAYNVIPESFKALVGYVAISFIAIAALIAAAAWIAKRLSGLASAIRIPDKTLWRLQTAAKDVGVGGGLMLVSYAVGFIPRTNFNLWVQWLIYGAGAWILLGWLSEFSRGLRRGQSWSDALREWWEGPPPRELPSPPQTMDSKGSNQ
jgi:hypothetical protein